MSFVHDEFKDYLSRIAEALQGDDYRRVIKNNLGSSLNEVEKEKIKAACKRLISVLGGKEREEFIDDFRKQIEIRKKIEKKYGNNLVNRQDAIAYTEQSESNFDKKVRENDLIKDRNGKPGFRIDDLRKIMKFNLDSKKLALCINSHYMLDRKRKGFLPFYGGQYYKIIEENEKLVWLYNEKWMATLGMPRSVFEVHFRVEEDLKF
jgi:hypothetical protein